MTDNKRWLPTIWNATLKGFGKAWVKEPVAFLGVLIGIPLFVVSYLQWQATVDASIAQSRAWMTPASIVLNGQVKAGEPLTVSVDIKNTGPSPAIDMVGKIALTRQPIDQYAVIEGEPLLPPSLAVIGADGVITFTSDPLPALSQQNVDGLANGTSHLVAFVRIQYRDIFQKQRRTALCFQWPRDHDTTNRAWSNCPAGNSAN